MSFYNESPKTAVFPTPVIGMVGIIEDEKSITPMSFQNAGDSIYLLGETDSSEIGGSQFQKLVFGKYFGKPPKIRLDSHKRNIDFLLSAIDSGLVENAHDISDGGIGITIAECAMNSGELGAKIDIPKEFEIAKLLWLFSESQARFLIGVRPKNNDSIEKLALEMNIPLTKLGYVIDEKAIVIGENKWNIDEISNLYESTISNAMKG